MYPLFYSIENWLFANLTIGSVGIGAPQQMTLLILLITGCLIFNSCPHRVGSLQTFDFFSRHRHLKKRRMEDTNQNRLRPGQQGTNCFVLAFVAAAKVTFDYKTCKLSISSLQYLDTNSGEAWQ
jgi:hypothetical protein